MSDTSDFNGLSRKILRSKWIDQTGSAASNYILAQALTHDFMLEEIGRATKSALPLKAAFLPFLIGVQMGVLLQITQRHL
jgi:hypothetical protein